MVATASPANAAAIKRTLEAVIYWELNPWSADYGKIKVYALPVELRDTGIVLTPDTGWHTFTLTGDFATQRYKSIRIDNEIVDLGDIPLAEVSHPDWGNEVALSLTTESMAAWPGIGCPNVFTWTTQFKDVDFRAVENSLSWSSVAGHVYQVQGSTDLRNWFNLGAAISGSGQSLGRSIDLGCAGGFLRVKNP